MAYSSNTTQFATLKTYGKSRVSRVNEQNDDFDKFLGIEDVHLTTFISPEQTDTTKMIKPVNRGKNNKNKMKTILERPSETHGSSVKKNCNHFKKKNKKSNYSQISGNSKGTPTSEKKTKNFHFPKKVICSTPLQTTPSFACGKTFNTYSSTNLKKKNISKTNRNLGHAFNISYSLEVIKTPDYSHLSGPSLSSRINYEHRLINKSVLLSGCNLLPPLNKKLVLKNKFTKNETYGYNQLEAEKYHKSNLKKPSKSHIRIKKKKNSTKTKESNWCKNTMDILQKKIPSPSKELFNINHDIIDEITNLEKSLVDYNHESITALCDTKNLSTSEQQNKSPYPDLISNTSFQYVKNTNKSSSEEDCSSATDFTNDGAIRWSQSNDADKSKLSNNSLYVSCSYHLDESTESPKSDYMTIINVSANSQISVDTHTGVNNKLSELVCDNPPCMLKNDVEFNRSCLNLDNLNKSPINFDLVDESVQNINRSNMCVYNENSFQSVNLSYDSSVCPASDSESVCLLDITNKLSDVKIDQHASIYKTNFTESKENIDNVFLIEENNDVSLETSFKHPSEICSVQHNDIYRESNISSNNSIILNQFLNNSSLEMSKYLDNTIYHSDSSLLNVNVKSKSIISDDSSIVNQKPDELNSDQSSLFSQLKDNSTDFDNKPLIEFNEDTQYGHKANNLNDISYDNLGSITPNLSQSTRRKRYAFRFSSCINNIIEESDDENQIDVQNSTKTHLNYTQSILPQKNVPLLRLEPGKKWRRSMLIARNFIDGNLDSTSYFTGNIFKNRKWSSTLDDIMQQQSIDSSFHQSVLDKNSTLNNSMCCSSQTYLQNISSGSANEIAKEYILDVCNQKQPVSFESWLNPKLKKKWKKVGEGVYGEVFSYAAAKNKTIVKIIPIEGKYKINDERQKLLFEVYSEILIATELTKLSDKNNYINQTRSFCNLKNLSYVQGKYPDHLISHWTQYAHDKQTYNDNPNILPDDQIFMILEMEDGGTDVEEFVFKSASQALYAFIQLVFGLAVAEHHLNFEHRDLHTGNILVKKIPATKHISYTLDSQIYSVPSHGIKVTIIDFTLSRMTYQNKSIYNDLSVDVELFNGVIDENSDYQFQIYPMMREVTKNKWDLFKPKTNIYWLHYVLDKMLTSVHYKQIKSVKRTGMDSLQQLKDAILSFDNVKCFAESDIILNYLE